MRLSQSALAAFTHARRSAPSYDTVPLPSLCARRSDEKRGLNCDPSNRHVSPSGPRLRPSAAGRVSAPRHDIRNPLSRRATQHAFAHKTSPAAGHLHLLRLGIDRNTFIHKTLALEPPAFAAPDRAVVDPLVRSRFHSPRPKNSHLEKKTDATHSEGAP